MSAVSDWCKDAIKEDPDGVTCGRCLKPNDFWDDCGWFYWSPVNRINIALCESCFREIDLTTGER